MIFRQIIALLCCAVMLLGSVFQPVEAKWFGKKKTTPEEDAAVERVRTFQPPPENAITMYCEPYRVEAIELSKKPALLKIFYQPRRSWVIHKHRKCKQNIMEQQNTYLKHVDIEQAPRLPKLETGLPATPATLPSETKEAPNDLQ